MDRYKKLMCVKGLIMSLDEQFYRLDQGKSAGLHAYDVVLNKYWDAIKEQLSESEKQKEDCGEK